jgi:RNA polymerase sigma-70 factor, ECF subfamily
LPAESTKIMRFTLPEQKLSWIELQGVEDSELIPQLLSGNHDALAVIVDRYQRLVFSVALRIVKDEGEAEDVVQIVFADIFKRAEQFDTSRGTLKMWLLQYAYSRSINRRHYLEQRQFYSQLDVDDLNPLGFSAGRNRSEGLSTAEVGRLLEQAIHSLKPNQQTAITLVYFEGLTLEEAAQRTGETLAAIRHHYYRGLMKLREFISSNKGSRQQNDTEAIPLEAAHLKPRPI